VDLRPVRLLGNPRVLWRLHFGYGCLVLEVRMSISREVRVKVDAKSLADRDEILARLRDYEQEGAAQIRDRLVARWRTEHPDAANESSATFHPLMRMEEWKKRGPTMPDEVWFNDTYNVTVRRFHKDPVFSSRSGGMVQIGICSFDGTARHDWRDFQAIKNQLAGEECEALELYPAESRLLDPSNYYTLWCFPGVRRLNIGQPERKVRDADAAWAPQRKLAP
jgi:hypothetical protein